MANYNKYVDKANAADIVGRLRNKISDVEASLTTKEPKLPTYINGKYLHVNNDTGNLEWIDAQGGSGEKSITLSTGQVSGVLTTEELSILDSGKENTYIMYGEYKLSCTRFSSTNLRYSGWEMDTQYIINIDCDTRQWTLTTLVMNGLSVYVKNE